MANQVGIFDVLKMIFILAVILFCTYYVTKLLAAKATGMSSSKGLFTAVNSNSQADVLPKVIFRTMVNRDSSMVVIEYDNKDYLVVMTPGGVEVIEKRELSQEEIDRRTSQRQQREEHSFSNYMDRYVDKFKESQSGKGEKKD